MRGDSSASAGTTPSSFWRANVSSRITSQPLSNTPWYLSDHSRGTWCGTNQRRTGPASPQRDEPWRAATRFAYEQLRDDAVDCAAESSASADCVMLLTASEAESASGTALTADSKLLQALERSPGSAS